MENQKNNKGVIALLIVIIVILLVLCILFATGTISFNSNAIDDIKEEKKEVTGNDIYSNFLNTKGYLNNFSESEHGVVSGVSYTYYDLDNNGIEELIIYISDGPEFGTNLFYTYIGNEIKFIDKIYHFGNLTYNKVDGSIVYTATRPSTAYGYIYEFYKLNSTKFELAKTVGLSIEDGKETYFIDDKTISKDEYDKYFDNNINFDFNELSN